jgi:O-succinylbenzoate synthase
MRIERLILREIELPLRTPFVTAQARVTHRRLLLVTLEDEDGREGWAECVAGAVPGYTTETVDSAWDTIVDHLAPLVVGTADDVSEVVAGFDDRFSGQPMVRAAIEMAGWDLAARQRGVPLVDLLGGTRTTVAAGIALGLASSPDALADEAVEAAKLGYQRIKVKIKPGFDMDPIRAVRERLGNEAMLTVDANGSYTRADIDHLARLDEFDLSMIEQPLPAGDLEGHADLQRRTKTPICVDESVSSLDDLGAMIDLGAGRVLNLKPGRVGGYTTALSMIERAEEHGLALWVGGMLETGIGRAHNVALAARNEFTSPGDLGPSDRYWEHDIVNPPWIMEQGSLPVPRTTPGLGVSPELTRINATTTRRQEIRAAR